MRDVKVYGVTGMKRYRNYKGVGNMLYDFERIFSLSKVGVDKVARGGDAGK